MNIKVVNALADCFVQEGESGEALKLYQLSLEEVSDQPEIKEKVAQFKGRDKMLKRVVIKSSAVSIVLGCIIFCGFCSQAGKIQKTLPEKDKEFLSDVRYIISKKEERVF